jgi:hypothetical protein
MSSATSLPQTLAPPGGRITSVTGSQSASRDHIEALRVTRSRYGSAAAPKTDVRQSTKGFVSATQCCAVSTRFGATSVPEHVRVT